LLNKDLPICHLKITMLFLYYMPSVLWRCWLGGRKSIRPVKTEWWGAGVVICLKWDAHLHTAQLMPLPLTVSCSSKIQIGFTFLVLAHPGSPGQRAIKWTCVCFILQDEEHNCSQNWYLHHIQQTVNDFVYCTWRAVISRLLHTNLTWFASTSNTACNFETWTT